MRPTINPQNTSETPAQPQQWISLARLMRPQGRKGELLCELLTDLAPETQFPAGREVMLTPANATQPAPGAQPTTIESFFLPTGKNAGRIVLKLSGSDSISEAELLAGRQIMVPASELPVLDPDTFYVADLVGCTLFNGPAPVGTVVDVEFAMSPDGKTRLAEAAPLFVIELPGSTDDDDTLLIPFVRAYLESVDLPAKRITMNLPSGFLDTEDDTTSEDDTD